MLLFFLLFPKLAFAYLDPSTGSALIYAIFGISFTVFYTVKGYFYSLKNFVFNKKAKKLNINQDIIFFTEGGQYKNTFIPILKNLDQKSISYKIFTLDENDEILKHSKNAEYLGSGAYAFAVLSNLTAKVLVCTTPQLDVLQFKKSKHVKHYIHVVHSCTDISFYKRYALDHFDSVFISGSHQESTIREMEKLRGYKPKNLVKTGLCYFDEMTNEVKPSIEVKEQKTILVAPSWGANGMFTLYGVEFLSSLKNINCKVIIRPHPQIKISQPDIFVNIKSFVQNSQNFELDEGATPERALSCADFLISDFSGIIFDFVFLKEMPAFILEYNANLKGYEAEDLPNKPIWELEVIKQIGLLIKKENLSNLDEIIKNIDILEYKNNIIKLKQNSIYNFGKAGESVAKEILNICSTL